MSMQLTPNLFDSVLHVKKIEHDITKMNTTFCEAIEPSLNETRSDDPLSRFRRLPRHRGYN